MNKRLLRYLLRIRNNETINFKLFVDALPEEAKADWHQLFRHKKQLDGKSQVTVLDNEAFAQLLAGNVPAENRVAAAKLGDSHKVATSHSFMLVYHNQLPDNRPDVVLIDRDRMLQSFSAKKHLLIIENEENFFRYQEMLPLLSGFFGSALDLGRCDIVFGAGNQITKALNLRFFGQYQRILCAFDLDFGGLTMFHTLKKGLAEQVPVVLLMPEDFSGYSDCFVKKPQSHEQWQKALALADRLGFTTLHETFMREQRFMEQEVLLGKSFF